VQLEQEIGNNQQKIQTRRKGTTINK